MKVMFDTNVVLDIVGRREPFKTDSNAAYIKVAREGNRPCLAAHAYPTIHYLLKKYAGDKAKRDRAMGWIVKNLEATPVDGAIIADAWQSAMKDFEDAIIVASAKAHGCGLIVTRNIQDFEGSPIRVLTPAEFVATA